MSSLPNNDFSESIFEKRKNILLKDFNSHMICYNVVKNFFVSFEISGGSYNPSQNTLRLINKLEKCVLSLLESLIADFIQFSSAIAKFLFPQGRLGTRRARFLFKSVLRVAETSLFS